MWMVKSGDPYFIFREFGRKFVIGRARGGVPTDGVTRAGGQDTLLGRKALGALIALGSLDVRRACMEFELATTQDQRHFDVRRASDLLLGALGTSRLALYVGDAGGLSIRTHAAEVASVVAAVAKAQKTWIEFQLVDSANEPLKNVDFEIELPNGSVQTGTTNSKGEARFQGIDVGECAIRFPDLMMPVRRI